MKGSIASELLLTIFILFMLPFLFVYGVFAGLWLAALTPLLLVVVLVVLGIKGLIKHKVECVVPPDAKPAEPRQPRKPILIKWGGKKVPLGIFIFSFISSVFLVLLLIAALILWLPWYWMIGTIILLIGVGIGSAR
jgi:hypothetical protein